MLLSICAVLADREDSRSSFPGQAAHAIFLGLIGGHEPHLAEELHSKEGRKPFTTSILRNKDGKYLRFTTYSPPLSELLLRILREQPPNYIEVEGRPIPIERWCLSDFQHPEVRKTTYYEIIARWLSGRNLPRSIKLRFLSPTTFRSAGKNVPLPLPHFVFGSLLEEWNSFAPFALGLEVREIIEKAVAVSGFRLHSELISITGGKQVGFMGHCTYTVTEENPFALACLHLLADFAFYSGVGAKTTMGMGQVRRIR